MTPVKNLGPEYIVAGELDVGKNWKIALALNLVGLALLLLFGWLFLWAAATWRPEIDSPNLIYVLFGLEPLALALGLIGVLIAHELVHGFFFWVFTGERPSFGFHLLYAYAAAPNWYLPRNRFLVVGLAPFVLITFGGLILLTKLPIQAISVLLLALTFNAAGSVGDLVVAGWLTTKPSSLMVRDVGPRMTFYQLAPPDITPLSERWFSLMDSMSVDPDAARRAFADLVGHYTEQGRTYHNLEHVRSVLDMVGNLHDLAIDMPAIQLAVWFHDVIYVPSAKDNEIRSAEYARQALLALGLPAETIARVGELILTTADHQAPDNDMDAQIVIDADLAPLADDEAIFERQSRALRKEFHWMPEAEYQANRAQFLTGILARDRIYQTDRLFSALESKARRNLTKAVSSIPE